VIFDVTSANPEVHKSAAGHLRLMSESYPDSKFEMVIYSGAYSMVDDKSSAAGETLRKLVKLNNVSRPRTTCYQESVQFLMESMKSLLNSKMVGLI